MKKYLLMGASALLLTLAGCQAPRGLQHEVSAPEIVVDAPQSAEIQKFAQSLADIPMGGTVLFGVSPQGPVQVSKDREYMNALGEKCYRYTLKNEQTQKHAAVCRVNDEYWRYVELVH